VSASKEIHSFSGIVRKTVETRVSINAAMIPTQKSAFAIFHIVTPGVGSGPR
jgi:hypothetical protein